MALSRRWLPWVVGLEALIVIVGFLMILFVLR